MQFPNLLEIWNGKSQPLWFPWDQNSRCEATTPGSPMQSSCLASNLTPELFERGTESPAPPYLPPNSLFVITKITLVTAGRIILFIIMFCSMTLVMCTVHNWGTEKNFLDTDTAHGIKNNWGSWREEICNSCCTQHTAQRTANTRHMGTFKLKWKGIRNSLSCTAHVKVSIATSGQWTDGDHPTNPRTMVWVQCSFLPVLRTSLRDVGGRCLMWLP